MSRPVALVTGIDGGIGGALRAVLSDLYDVVGLARAPIAGDDHVFACDLRDVAATEHAFAQAAAAFGTPTRLVNCAGIYKALAWERLSAKDFDDTYAVNLRAPFVLSQLFARRLVAEGKGGVIVNVASVSGVMGSIDPAYASTKAGVIMLTKTMSKAMAPQGIRVCAVAPGPVDDTAMGARIPVERAALYRETIPMKRFATPPEVAQSIRFLLGDEAGYVTGSVLAVDGGLL